MKKDNLPSKICPVEKNITATNLTILSSRNYLLGILLLCMTDNFWPLYLSAKSHPGFVSLHTMIITSTLKFFVKYYNGLK